MALVNMIEPHVATARLTQWLSSQAPAPASASARNVEQPAVGGLSNEILFFEACQDGVAQPAAARIQPRGNVLYERFDLDTECRVMKAVAAQTALPVPRILGYEPSDDVLGSPFFVMER